jgi:hypothetical protein
MTRQHNSTDEVRPVDMEVGGDDDMPGISQELTTDDIDDIAFDTQLSVADRHEQLTGLLTEMRARQASDYMGDMANISSHIEDRIASLGNARENDGVIESTGMDADSRSDDDDPADHIDDDDGGARLEDLSRHNI